MVSACFKCSSPDGIQRRTHGRTPGWYLTASPHRTIALCDECWAGPPQTVTRHRRGTCQHCGKPLPAGSRSNRLYCSSVCKLRAHRRRHDPWVGSERRRLARERALETLNDGKWKSQIQDDFASAGTTDDLFPDFGEDLPRIQGRSRGTEEAVRAAQIREATQGVVSLESPKKPLPLWIELVGEMFDRGAQTSRWWGSSGVKLGGQWLRPTNPQFWRFVYGAVSLNPRIETKTRGMMEQVADMDFAPTPAGKVERLERRVNRLENTLTDYAFESEASARKVRARLDRVQKHLGRYESEARRLLDSRGL